MPQQPLASKGNYFHIYDFWVKPGTGDKFLKEFEDFDYSDDNPMHKSPAQVKENRVAAKKQDVVRRVKTGEGKMDWRPILCETNASRGMVSKIQQALYNQGFDPGPIDGVMGQGTHAAVRAFQKKKGLAVGGLTMETLKALGVRA